MPPCGPSPSAQGRKEKRKEDGPLSAQQTRSQAGLFVPCRPSWPVKPQAELALFASRAAHQYEPSLCWAACTLPARYTFTLFFLFLFLFNLTCGSHL